MIGKKKVRTGGRILDVRRALRGGDLALLLSVICLAIYGTVMVASAGAPYAEARYGDGAYFIKRQIIWVAVGFAVMLGASRLRIAIIEKYSSFAYALTLGILGLTLIIGTVGNGAQRWIAIGPITIQPSEIAKLTLILMLARYFSTQGDRATLTGSRRDSFIFGTLFPCLILVAPILLVMLQHHLSCIIILGMLGLLIIVCAGIRLGYILGFIGAGAVGVTCIALFTDYTKDRITVWRDPEAYKLTGGWQTLQGLMAIGSGGVFGKGLGNGELKHCYVSEPANDMIFAILCEELGLVGAIVALLLFGIVVFRGYRIAMRAEGIFPRLVALGISFKMAIQVLLNVAVVTNTIPNTGISLPLFSYGGSSLIMIFFEMGILLSISRESRLGGR